MKITFSIEYHTHWGEELFLMLSNDRYSALKMYYTPGDIWQVSLDVSGDTRQLRYRYMVKEGDEVTRVEQCTCHTLSLDAKIKHYRVDDVWNDSQDCSGNDDFIGRLTGDGNEAISEQYQPGTIMVEARVPVPARGIKPAIVGEAHALGSWNVRQAVPMKPCGDSLWRVALTIPDSQLPTQFKLVITGKRGDVQWESGGNRWLLHAPHKDEVTLVRDLKFRHDGNLQPQVATMIELSTLRSDRDMGIGDLCDLKKVIQWAATAGQNAVVMNCISDASVVDGWMPIDMRKRITENAIDPAYVCVAALGTFADRKLMAQYQKTGMALNCLDEAPIDEVRALKMAYCQAVFADNGALVIRTAAYRKFVAQNVAWLRPYAAQAILQRVNQTADSSLWGNYSRYNPEQVERFLKARHREATFIFYLQYQLRQQLLAMAKYARTKKIALRCDMTAPRYVKSLDPKEPWVNQRFIEQRLREATEMVLIPLWDWLLIDGGFLPRVSKTESKRLPVSLEELIAAHDFNARVKSIMAPEKRTP